MEHEQQPDVRLSECMAVYQRPRYLAGAIESLLAQTHGEWRLTGSVDGSGTIAAIVAPHLGGPRIRFVTHDGTNLGGDGNHTKLLSLATAPKSPTSTTTTCGIRMSSSAASGSRGASRMRVRLLGQYADRRRRQRPRSRRRGARHGASSALRSLSRWIALWRRRFRERS